MTNIERAKQLRLAIQFQAAALPDEQAAQVPTVFPLWNATGVYEVGDRVRYADLLYKCLTGHTAQESWTAKVSHNGKHWTSDVAANVWEPGVYGWTEVA